MIYSQADLLKLIHDTRAVSIWNHDKGPVFWYAANVPGPFYVNTEMTVGADLSARLLREITAIVAGTVDVQARSSQLNKLIMGEFKKTLSWQLLIASMVERAKQEWKPGSYQMISGGERRDWIFSIPFAQMADMPHLFLFKNKTHFCAQPVTAGQNVLHVSDLINNGASFLELWQPALQALKLGCAGNLCVNLRGENGLKRLTQAGQKTVSLVTIDLNFFRHLRDEKLITQAVFEEISIFFASAQDWAATYLIGRPELFDVAGCDAKSFERLKFFVAHDPWKLRPTHEAFFASMQQAITSRENKAA